MKTNFLEDIVGLSSVSIAGSFAAFLAMASYKFCLSMPLTFDAIITILYISK